MSTSARYLAVVLPIAAVVLAGLGYAYLAPKGTTMVDDALPDGAEPLASGAFSGADAAHRVSGIVTMYRAADGSHFLRFEDYDATDGPDVFFYLVPAGEGYDADGFDGRALKVLVAEGRNGQATLRGSFNVPLPADLDPAAWGGVAAWCDRFNVLFGDAELTAA